MSSSGPSKPLRVIFATDGSEHARAAACLLNDLAFPPRSSITVLGVLVPRDASSFALLEKVLDQTKASLKGAGIEISAELQTGYPAEKVMEAADAQQADLIVLGAKGLRHTLGILLGGVAQQVVEYSSHPVLVVRAPYNGLRRILLVTDGSIHSQHLIEFLTGPDKTGLEKTGSGKQAAFPLPKDYELSVAHVLAPVGYYFQYLTDTYMGTNYVVPMDKIAEQEAEEEARGREILTQAIETLQQAGIEAAPVLMSGDAATEIIEHARTKQIDLILVGSRGLSGARGWLLGSVSRKLVHYAGCSVLVVK